MTALFLVKVAQGDADLRRIQRGIVEMVAIHLHLGCRLHRALS